MKGPLIRIGGGVAAVALAFIACLLLPTLGRVAQAQQMPPFPILYGGMATVDGEPLPEGTRVTARVGDYETWTTVEKNGTYRNLLLGPPNRDYYTVPVTFHAMGLTAVERDVFLRTGAPLFKSTGFDLHFLRPLAEASPTPTLQAPTEVDSGGDGVSLTPMAQGSPEPSPSSTPTVQSPAEVDNGDNGASITPMAQSSPEPSASPTPTVQESQGVGSEGQGFSIVWMAVGAGVILVALTGWLGLRNRWKRS